VEDNEEPKESVNFDVELEDGNELVSAAAQLTSRNENSQKSKRKIVARRTFRHIKNSVRVILALSALADGAFYNLREMFALAPDHT